MYNYNIGTQENQVKFDVNQQINVILSDKSFNHTEAFIVMKMLRFSKAHLFVYGQDFLAEHCHITTKTLRKYLNNLESRKILRSFGRDKGTKIYELPIFALDTTDNKLTWQFADESAALPPPEKISPDKKDEYIYKSSSSDLIGGKKRQDEEVSTPTEKESPSVYKYSDAEAQKIFADWERKFGCKLNLKINSTCLVTACDWMLYLYANDNLYIKKSARAYLFHVMNNDSNLLHYDFERWSDRHQKNTEMTAIKRDGKLLAVNESANTNTETDSKPKLSLADLETEIKKFPEQMREDAENMILKSTPFMRLLGRDSVAFKSTLLDKLRQNILPRKAA